VTRLLKDSYTVYAIDLPNHGLSAHTEESSLSSMAAAVAAWMDDIGLSKAHFLGHSLGGKVSMELALRQPERVVKLIVADIAPVAYQRRHDDVFAGFRVVDLKIIEHRADAYRDMEPFVSGVLTRDFLLKNLFKEDGRWRWKINLDVLERDYDKLIDGNTTELPPFDGPVLFIKGEKSSYILPVHREAILDRFPRANIRTMSGTDHWLHAEKPEMFASIVKRFLAS
jgi:esterase